MHGNDYFYFDKMAKSVRRIENTDSAFLTK